MERRFWSGSRARCWVRYYPGKPVAPRPPMAAGGPAFRTGRVADAEQQNQTFLLSASLPKANSPKCERWQNRQISVKEETLHEIEQRACSILPSPLHPDYPFILRNVLWSSGST